MPLRAPAANGSECCEELFWTSELLTGWLQMEIDVTRPFETHWRLAGSVDRQPVDADICVVVWASALPLPNTSRDESPEGTECAFAFCLIACPYVDS